MNRYLKILFCFLTVFAASHVFSDADGPDYWEVTGVQTGHNLNIRQDASVSSEKIGKIPHDGTCIKNQGCIGGLTYSEYTSLSQVEKNKILKERPRWCQVEYQGQTGWVAGRYLKEGSCNQKTGSPAHADIISSWQGDYPTDKLHLLPGNQQDLPVGYFSDSVTFSSAWAVFQPGKEAPDVDFKTHVVIFVRNTQFYNRISIGQIMIKEGIADVLAMETMTAMPIEEKVAMSMALVSRAGITAINSGDKTIQID